MSSQYPGHLFLIAAASGTGKTSLVKSLLADDPRLKISISATTRSARPAEVDGKDYYFYTESQFQAALQQNAFLEHAKVHNNYYGTPKSWVQEQLSQGNDVILEIDWQGARQIRQSFPHLIDIFILPPSLDTLRSRLIHRAQDSMEIIDVRVHNAKEEISHANEFRYVIMNDNFEDALANLRTIVAAARLEFSNQAFHNKTLFQSLHIS